MPLMWGVGNSAHKWDTFQGLGGSLWKRNLSPRLPSVILSYFCTGSYFSKILPFVTSSSHTPSLNSSCYVTLLFRLLYKGKCVLTLLPPFRGSSRAWVHQPSEKSLPSRPVFFAQDLLGLQVIHFSHNFYSFDSLLRRSSVSGVLTRRTGCTRGR